MNRRDAIGATGTGDCGDGKMNRRQAILSTVLAFFGLGAAKAKPAESAIQDQQPWPMNNPNYGMTWADPSSTGQILRKCNGVTFIEDVSTFLIVRRYELLPNGRAAIAVTGYVDLKRKSAGCPIEVDMEPGHFRLSHEYSMAMDGRRVSFKVVDMIG